MTDTLKNELAASDAEQEEPQSDSVYDFLYHDVRRVGSFLAQFDDAGHLQRVTQSEGVVRGIKRGWRFKVAGSVADLASGEIGAERSPVEGASEAGERVYDPLWANARTLLDYLAERDMIRRQLAGTRIGQLVLIKGLLLILDLTMLKTAWSKPAIKKLMQASERQTLEATQLPMNRNERRRHGREQSQQTVPSNIDFILEMLSLLPHSIQARLFGDNFSVWCTLEELSIVGHSSDLILKHGAIVSGEWTMLGILDAFPDQHPDEAMQSALAEITGTPIGAAAAHIGPVARQALGRPTAAFGVTPLLIFREVTG